jgi:hypothetical protein
METTNYLILGFAVIFGVLFVHTISIYLRDRNLHGDLSMLEKFQGTSVKKTTIAKKKRSRG